MVIDQDSYKISQGPGSLHPRNNSVEQTELILVLHRRIAEDRSQGSIRGEQFRHRVQLIQCARGLHAKIEHNLNVGASVAAGDSGHQLSFPSREAKCRTNFSSVFSVIRIFFSARPTASSAT